MGTLYLFTFSVNIKLVLNIESISKNKKIARTYTKVCWAMSRRR